MNKINLIKNNKIIIIGAGISGIVMAIYLKTKLKFNDFIIIESREEVGGTWLVNKYPGAACDEEIHLYSLYSNLNPDWSINFAGHKEIHNYWVNLVKIHDLRSKIIFNSTVKSARFNQGSSKWELEVNIKELKSNTKLDCDILIGAVGYLRVPNKPEIFSNFKGPIMHSAEWNSKIDIEDKIVGLVGAGASAVQIVPNIIDKVKKLYTFQKSSSWIIPRFKENYTENFKFLLNWVPGLNKLYYWKILLKDDFIYHNAFIKNSLTSKYLTWYSKKFVAKSIKDPLKRDLMTPNYDLGCKRVTPSDTYLKAINDPKCTVNDGNIDYIEGNTVYSKDGTSTTVDILILATGFKTNFPYSEIDITNLDGDHLDKAFHTVGKIPSIKYGITHAKMPNFFQLCGPTTNIGHTSATWMIECQANYIVKLIHKMETNSIKTIELKEEVGIEYWKWVQNKMKLTSLSSNCGSWYKNANGETIANWPSTGLSYYRKTSRVKLSDYHCTKI